jgi:hypothetical protein
MTGTDDDFLSYIRQHHRELVSGVYRCRIVPKSLTAFSTEHSTGVSFTLVIVEGDYKNREFSVRLCARNDKFTPVVTRDLNIVAAWAKALGVTGGKDLLGLMFAVGKATEAAGGVNLKINVRSRNGFKDIYISQVFGSGKEDSNVI